MKFNSKKVVTIILMLFLTIVISGDSLAHSGKTDANGGHKDNQNKSGLGSYHYHCGGHPAHLHNNGVCPYSSGSSNSSNVSNNKKNTSKSESESVPVSSSVESTTIQKTIIKASSIEINENIGSMKVGESKKLTVTITPNNTEDTSIKWQSSDEDIITVSSTGRIVALKSGRVTITVTTSNGKTDSISIDVEEKIENKNTIVVSTHNNKVNSTSTNNSEESDVVSGILGLGLLGGGSYWVYKKHKNKTGNK